MTKRLKKWEGPSGYLTIGRKVHLGKTTAKVRKNAIAAGLEPVTAKAMRKLIESTMAMQRIMSEGTWYDTVRY